MQSDLEGPTIVGGDAYVTVDELVETVIDASGKEIGIEHVEGPVGVHAPELQATSRCLSQRSSHWVGRRGRVFERASPGRINGLRNK
jgi:hypothetical protein